MLNTIVIIAGIASSLGIGAWVGSFLQSRFEANAENKRKLREKKEEKYFEFMTYLSGFSAAHTDRKLQDKFVAELNTKAFLYISDRVYLLSRKFVESIDKEKKLSQKAKDAALHELMRGVRKELFDLTGEATTLEQNDIQFYKLD